MSRTSDLQQIKNTITASDKKIPSLREHVTCQQSMNCSWTSIGREGSGDCIVVWGSSVEKRINQIVRNETVLLQINYYAPALSTICPYAIFCILYTIFYHIEKIKQQKLSLPFHSHNMMYRILLSSNYLM